MFYKNILFYVFKNKNYFLFVIIKCIFQFLYFEDHKIILKNSYKV